MSGGQSKDSHFQLETDLIILAMGFLYPQYDGMVEMLGIQLDSRGNIYTDKNYKTSVDKVFSAGDMRNGQSLVVKAIRDGRQVARSVDEYLMGKLF